MKKYLISPFFAPIFFSACWLLLVGGIFVFAHKNLSLLLEEHGILENITNIAYIPLWITYICLAKFFFSLNKNAKIDFVLYVVLGISAFLRELGIQHWLASKDTTAFKSRFFLNPNNPISEKIIAGLILIALLIIILYLAKKYTKHLVCSFFKMNPTTWSIATLCTWGIVGKFIDRFPSNYKKAYGEVLNENIFYALKILEETSEIFLPIIAAFILYQYRLINKKQSKLGKD